MKVLDFHVHPTIGYKYAKEEKNPREFAEKLYVDTSYSILNIVKQYKLAEYIFILDSEKFIFSSDVVLGLTPEEFRAKRQVKIVENFGIETEDKGKILYENARKLL